MELLFPLLIVFMIGMIFFSNRQRKKQAQQQESLQNSIAVGDVVVMTSGISGTVVDTDDDKTIDLEIAPDVITTWLRAAVREKLAGDADVLVGDVEHLGEAPTVGAAEHEVITDAPVDRSASAHTTGTGTAAHGTAAPAAGSDGAAAEPSFSDPTATPNGNGVSAGSSNPGDPRSSS
jgi:preprotein translocase subunit YajC